ncbi:outer membrane beta-barrel protein [Tenuifilum thalassicum]|nr:outer membrane beta-barrel protein [Tenuifilum thalassicum]
MKRIIALSIILLLTSQVFAQLFVGGNIGLSMTGGKVDNGNTSVDKQKVTSFAFAPMAGMFLNDKLAVGTSLSFNLNNTKTPGNPEQIDRTTSFGVTPFVRYYAFTVNKFSLFAQANVGFAYSVEKSKVGSTTTTGPKTSTLSINASPGIAYNLSEKVQLEAHINGFNFGYSRISVKDNNNTDITNSFGLGVDLDNIATSGFITIGAIVKL